MSQERYMGDPLPKVSELLHKSRGQKLFFFKIPRLQRYLFETTMPRIFDLHLIGNSLNDFFFLSIWPTLIKLKSNTFWMVR